MNKVIVAAAAGAAVGLAASIMLAGYLDSGGTIRIPESDIYTGTWQAARCNIKEHHGFHCDSIGYGASGEPEALPFHGIGRYLDIGSYF